MQPECFEIQILEDAENAAIKAFYAALSSNNPDELKTNFKRCIDRYKRSVKACIIMQEAYLQFHGIKNIESHTVILHPNGYAEIVNLDPLDEETEPFTDGKLA